MCLEDKLFEEFIERLGADERTFDTEKIERAYLCAKGCHEGQLRNSGEAYSGEHPRV